MAERSQSFEGIPSQQALDQLAWTLNRRVTVGNDASLDLKRGLDTAIVERFSTLDQRGLGDAAFGVIAQIDAKSPKLPSSADMLFQVLQRRYLGKGQTTKANYEPPFVSETSAPLVSSQALETEAEISLSTAQNQLAQLLEKRANLDSDKDTTSLQKLIDHAIYQRYQLLKSGKSYSDIWNDLIVDVDGVEDDSLALELDRFVMTPAL